MINLSVCKSNNPNGLSGWEKLAINSPSGLERAVKSYNYSAFGDLKDGYRKADNVENLCPIAIFDIDNDPGTAHLTIDEAQDLLKDVFHIILSSRSHQKNKDGKPAVDRFRVFIFLDKPLTAKKENYRLEMIKISERVGLFDFSDMKALKDISRQYYASPDNAVFIVNDANKFTVDGIISEAKADLIEIQNIRIEVKKNIKKNKKRISSDSNNYHTLIDVGAMNCLPLDAIYERFTGNKLVQEGSYLMGKGVSEGTSISRNSFTIFQDGESWLWHDFKSLESGNVLSFMEQLGFNAYEAALALEKKFNIILLVDNIEHYKKIFFDALSNSHNDKSFESEVKKISGADFVRLGKDDLRIADKVFKLSDFGVDKLYVINAFRERRSSALSVILGG
jgi:hypothetical protein